MFFILLFKIITTIIITLYMDAGIVPMLTMFRRLHSNRTRQMYRLLRATTQIVEHLAGIDVADTDTGTSHLLTSTTDVLYALLIL